ncbi:MAG: right-handed parallel beta-helix repeat-containing protein, partial [Bradymonadaceae bacterium]
VPNVALQGGEQVMRIAMDSDLFNINSLSILRPPEAPEGDFYVSPSGDDDGLGTLQAPFRTLERARDAVREINDHMDRDLLVYLRGGRYEQAATLTFDSRDSGTNGHEVIYRAYPGESPSISGGRIITGWTPHQNGIVKAPAQGMRFRQFYVGGLRAVRARTPNAGAFNRLITWNESADAVGVRIDSSQLDTGWDLSRTEMVIYKHWNQSRMRVESHSISGGHADIVLRSPERYVERLIAWPNRENNQVYYFENSLDFLDEPGEWFVDIDADQVYYMPRHGEDLQILTAIIPALERLVEVRQARHIAFEGLFFEHTGWTTPDDEGFIGIQAASYRVLDTGASIPAGIYLESTSHVRFERNVFRHMGGVGVELAFGTYRNEFVGNVFTDIASNAISIYTWLSNRNPDDENQKSRGDVIRNNYVTGIAQDYSGGVGIFASYTDGVVIEHNEIAELPYTGISVGWGWTSASTALKDNVVRYNHIHHVMQFHDDGAGIYTLSRQPGTLIERNHVHDIIRSPWADSYEIAALYLDEQTDGLTMRHNVIHGLSGDAVLVVKFHQAGDDNTVHDNGEGIADEQSIMSQAGLEPAYESIKRLVDN